MSNLEQAAAELHVWYRDLLALCERTVFGVAAHEPHRSAAVLGVLTRNAKLVTRSDVASDGSLYTPLCFVLAAACRHLGVEPGEREWLAAVKNVITLDAQLKALPATAVLTVGSAATIFKQHLDEALVSAGVTDQPTILDQRNRELALGLALNWGMRFLIAYAIEVVPRAQGAPKVHDLAWLAGIIRSAALAA